MFQKICQVASLLSLLLSVSMLGGGYFAYKYVTSPQLKNKIMNELMLNIQQSLPKVLDNLGIAIMSTSRGVMTNLKAKELGIGGEVLCYIW